jgi:hypothetical protein
MYSMESRYMNPYLPERKWWMLHGGNTVSSTVLFVFFWLWMPEWVRVPYAVLWGAVNMNTLTAYLVRRDLMLLESEAADDGAADGGL